ncbi:MAG: metal-dependent transcriptional regulator [Flavobacteriales bacterium]|nr:metal-dependent transcriptional regulator [Flavobacteriales bacterium]
MASQTVENYLKCIYALQQYSPEGVSTNAIAERLETQASSVTDMLKKLKTKGLVNYKKYKGAHLTDNGMSIAIDIIRRHRLWEVFLVEKLDFKWDEVHPIAEELEHIASEELFKRLDSFLGHPQYDPHGDPIPDADGNFRDNRDKVAVSALNEGEGGILVGVRDSSQEFLQYLDSIKLTLGSSITVEERFAFDQSVRVSLGKQQQQLSQLVARNLLVLKS